MLPTECRVLTGIERSKKEKNLMLKDWNSLSTKWYQEKKFLKMKPNYWIEIFYFEFSRQAVQNCWATNPRKKGTTDQYGSMRSRGARSRS